MSVTRPDEFFVGVGRRFLSLIIPVSLTIVAVVWSVNNLTPIYVNRSESPLVLVMREEEDSTALKKMEASILNALAIITLVVIMTFIIVLLYRCGCSFILFGWFAFSTGSIFFLMAWIWIDLVLTRFQIPYDFLTMVLVLWNLGVVGSISIFYYSLPIISQGYLIFASILMSWSMTALPDWTAWGILLAIATYDIVAVLAPGGPLKMLLEAAEERNEPIPGFVYDSEGAVQSAAPATEQQRAKPVRGQEISSLSLVEHVRYSSPFKLGLGDFIFYSLLVGKACKTGFLPWVLCFITILTGMIGTLVSLFLFRERLRALPALPISIFAATIIFFLCRYSLSLLASFSSTHLLVL